VWQAFAKNIGVVPVSVVDSAFLARLVSWVFVFAGLLAVAPAVLAARAHPAQLLHAE